MGNSMDNEEIEDHVVEWKESWNDEYLKWICGYANAFGGTLTIGKDDKGNIVGVKDIKKLLEAIPNKITDSMGVIADVNHGREGSLHYIDITVEKYPMLISYHGKYYYRSGSTMRTITGKELDRAILKSQGMTWDGMPVPKISVSDLRREAIEEFKKKSVARGRLTREEVSVDDDVLMDNLKVIDDDGYITRAGMLAFYEDPEKWVTGAYIKIGYFEKSDSDLVYYDDIHGSLIEQIDKAVDMVYSKYFKALIDYEGIQRVEQYMFHKDGFREILLNAVVHKDYSACNPIQISIYPDRFYVSNDGVMPNGLRTTEQLFKKHSSKPFNPKLAHIFFMSGMIEAWGRGFDKIRTACEEYNAELPEYEITEDNVMVCGKACPKYMELLNKWSDQASDQVTDQASDQVTDQDNELSVQDKIIAFCKTEKSLTEILGHLGYKNRTYFRNKYLNPMIRAGELKMKFPDKPNSSNQKYYS